jgi:ribosome biogenesis protein Tsr3
MVIDSGLITGSLSVSGSYTQTGNAVISGSLTVTGTINASITGSITTASYALRAETLDGLDSTVFTLTSSFQNYTSSANTRLSALEAASASLNSYTASTDAKITSINAFSASILNYTSSTDAKLTALYAFSSSLLSYTSSTDAKIASINNATSSLQSATSSLQAATASLYTTTASLNASIAGLNAQSASLLSYTSSTDAKIASIYTTTASLNAAVSSLNTATASLNSATASLYTATASFSAKVGSLEAQTASLLSYTSSNNTTNTGQNTRLSALEAATASIYTTTSSLNASVSSLNSYTQSTDAKIASIYTTTASLNASVASLNAATASLYTATSSFSAKVGALELQSASLLSYTASTDAKIASIYTTTSSLNASVSSLNAQTASLLSYTSSNNTTNTGQNTRLSALEAATASLYTTTASLNASVASLNTQTASLNASVAGLNTYTSSLNAKTASFATTGSNTFTGRQYISDASQASSFTQTASLYTDGGLRVTKDAYVSGTLYLNNLTVFGTQSISYISSSQLNIATNIITVNTSTPSIRFGGLAVQDSGSGATGLTGSILWDSQENHWVYTNPSGSSYSGGMFISGPRASSLGSEQGTTFNALMKGQGGDHITSSGIFESGSGNVGIGTSSPSEKLHVIGKILQNNGGSLYLDANATNTVIASTGARDLLFEVNSGNRLAILSGGNVGIGTTVPSSLLHVSKAGNSAGGTILMGVSNTIDKWSYLVSTQYNSGTHPQGFSLIGGFSSATVNTITIGGAIYEANPATEIQFWTHTAVSHSLGGSQRMTINSNGNVGIGSTSPSTKLDVIGDTFVKGVIFAYAGSGGNQVGGITWDSTDDGALFLKASNTNKIYLNSNGVSYFNGGNVGIGTTAPSSRLSIQNNGASDNIIMNFLMTNGSNAATFRTTDSGAIFGIHSQNSGDIYIKDTSDAVLFYGKHGGNVGIGTTAPSTTLTVKGTTVGAGLGKLSVYAGGDENTWNATRNEAIRIGRADIDSAYYHSIWSAAGSSENENSHWLRFYISNANGSSQTLAMTMNGNGNVGIGTTSPNQLLHLKTELATSSGVGTIIQIESGGSGGDQAWIGVNKGTGNGLEFSVENRDIIFNTGATSPFGGSERMRITSGGDVGIGTTNPDQYGFAGKLLTLNASSSYANLILAGDANSGIAFGTSTGRLGQITMDSSTGLQLFSQSTGNGLTMVLNRSGNVGIGTTSPTSKLTISGVTLSQSVSALDINASGSGYYQRGIRVLNSSMGNGDGILIQAGKADGIRNAGQMVFNHVSDGSTSNYLEFGLYAVDQVLNIVGTGNVGIGTIAPAYKLDVNGPINTNSYFRTTNSEFGIITDTITARDSGIKLNSNASSRPITFEINSSEKMRIHTNGFVGINTTSPDQLLRLNGVFGQPATSGTTQNGIIRMVGWSGGGSGGYGETLDMGFHVGLSGPPSYAWLQATNWSGLNINYNLNLNPNGGNVGIGTTTPAYRLQVSGNAYINETLYVNGATTVDDNFYVTNGNVGIGTTNPTQKLVVQGGASFRGGTNVTQANYNDSGSTVDILVDNQQPKIYSSYWSGTEKNLYLGTYSQQSLLVLTTGGSVGIGNTSPHSLLDVRGRQFVGGGTSTYVPTAGSSLIAREAGDTFIGVHDSGYGVMLMGWDRSEDRGTIAVDSSQDIVFITDMGTTDGADNLSGKTPKVTIKGGGCVGIGTTSPLTPLHIQNGNSTYSTPDNTNVPNVYIYNSNSSNTSAHSILTLRTNNSGGGNPFISFDVNQVRGYAMGIDNADGDKFKINVGWSTLNSDTKITLIPDGNVGIGTTSPSYKLDVDGTTRTTGNTVLASGGAYVSIGGAPFYAGTSVGSLSIRGDLYPGIAFYTGSGGLDQVGQIFSYAGTGNMILAADPRGVMSSTTMQFEIDGGTKMLINSNGNVGIGTTSPRAKLEVSGDIYQLWADAERFIGQVYVDGTSFRNGILTNSGTRLTQIEARAGDTSGKITFLVGASEAARIIHGGNIGIGTTSPGTRFHVFSTADSYRAIRIQASGSTGDAGIEFIGAGGNTFNIQQPGSSAGLFFYDRTNSATRMLIDAGGNVGIGTTSPTSKLHVVGDGDTVTLQKSNNVPALAFLGTSTNKSVIEGGDTFNFYTGGSSRLHITNGGNVGIGTTSPSGRLHVYQAAATDTYLESGTSGTTGKLIFKTSDNSDLNKYIMQEAYYMLFNGHANEGFKFRDSAGTTLMTIYGTSNTYAGRVGIGTTAPAFPLDVNGPGRFVSNASSRALYLVQNSVNAGNIIQFRDQSNADIGEIVYRNNQYYVYSNAIGGYIMYGDPSTGNVGIGYGTTSYKLDVGGTIRATGDVIAYSDARVKENVQTVENALSTITSLRGVTYTRNDNEDKSRKVGVIAQEVLPILPEVVQQDNEGNYSVAYGNMVGVLIEAIKEQQQQIDELKYLLQTINK